MFTRVLSTGRGGGGGGGGEASTPNTISSPQNIIINGLLYMFLFHFNINFLGSDFIRGAFQRPRFQNLFRRAYMFPDTWSHSTHGPMTTS